MTEFPEAYAEADDHDDRYRLLREEMTRLRDSAEKTDFFDTHAVRETTNRTTWHPSGGTCWTITRACTRRSSPT